MNTQLGKQILQHELTHVEEKHSWDKIFMQINLLFGWFNPMFWLIKKELGMIHEFIADKKSVPNANTELFAQMLLSIAFAGKQISLTNPFFFSPLKRRLAMLTKNKLPKFSYAQRIIALPVMALLVFIFSLKAQEITVKKVIKNNIPALNKPIYKEETKDTTNTYSPIANYGPDLLHFTLKKKYKVVIDAGHGGKDNGAIGINGIMEKDIALTYAKVLQDMNENNNIEFILTREGDVFSDPKQRADMINNMNADLFISLHCNTAEKETYKGVEIFTISKEKDNGYKKESDFLASYIGSYLMDRKFLFNGVHSRQAGVWILQETKCPGILVETGFVTNKEDAENLINEEYRKLMCQQILNGIQYYFSLQEQGIRMIGAEEIK